MMTGRATHLGVHEEEVQALRVAILLLGAQFLFARRNSVEEPLLVDERQEGDRLPRKGLAVHVELEVLGVEL